MTETFIALTEDEFCTQFRPLPNPIAAHAQMDFGDAKGCLIETYGPEWDFIKSFDRYRVWTLIDNNAGDMFILSGLHWINRLGYLITANPWPKNTTIEVTFEDEPDSEESS
ncbi:hypothetical protein GC197_03380 [bacterium]|nr:hypothetical protein [bacterium]